MTKEFILSEIQRVANQLGRAPGKREFNNATGLRVGDWEGRYWARWGDAVREAGYEPNRLQTAYPPEYRAEQMIALIRELRHFPSRSEMRLKRRSDATFPDANVYYRLGSRAAIVEFIRAFCLRREGYNDVLMTCDTALLTVKDEGGRQPDRLAVQGYVYMTRAGRSRYKIGRTNSPSRRHREIRLNIPEPTSQVHSIATDDPVGIEAYWHRRFESKRIPGTEFFKLDAGEVAAFKHRKFM